jgi:hypothetical protein
MRNRIKKLLFFKNVVLKMLLIELEEKWLDQCGKMERLAETRI